MFCVICTKTIKVFGVIIWRCCRKTSLGFSEAIDESAFIFNHSGVFPEVLPAIPLIWYLALDSFNAEKYLPAGRTGNNSQFYQPNQPVLALLCLLQILLTNCMMPSLCHPSLTACYQTPLEETKWHFQHSVWKTYHLFWSLLGTFSIFQVATCNISPIIPPHLTCVVLSLASNNFSHCFLSLQQLFAHHPSRLC